MPSDPPSEPVVTLYGMPGWGSAIVEGQLVWYGAPYDFKKTGDLFTETGAAERLRALNPLAQVPTLVLEDGSVMTESAAITLYLADVYGLGDLVPMAGEAERAQFLRWLIFITSNIYPAYTYSDDPSRFVPAEEARAGFAEAVDGYKKKMFGILDRACAAPFFLGPRFSALDIYIAVMTHWRPGRDWFAARTKRLAGVASKVEAMEEFGDFWTRNFPED